MEPMVVTPHRALRWLWRQAPHAHTGQAFVIERYAGEMRSGLWYARPEDPIVFDDRGTLVDGRCRLAALVVAGIPLTMHVVGWVYGPHVT